MAYQLRFLKSAPLKTWLDQMAVMLDSFLPASVWDGNPSASLRRLRIRRILRPVLLSFLERRSLCGKDPLCGQLCLPVPQNLAVDRWDRCYPHESGPLYLVKEPWTLEGMGRRLAEAVVSHFPTETGNLLEITAFLRDFLSSNLYENSICWHAPICRHSKPVSLEKEFKCAIAPSSIPLLEKNWFKKGLRLLNENF